MKNLTHPEVKLMRLSVLIVVGATFIGCGGTNRPTGPSFKLTVAPLSLTGIDYACYDIAVTGPAGPVVSFGQQGTSWLEGDAGTICSWQYGNLAGGDIAHVAPCDADDGDADSPAQATNTVTVWFDGLYVDPDGDHDPSEDRDVGGWQDPCPNGCSLDVLCRENSDTEVTFNFTVMRDAIQGFFDIAVEFDDIFCSAKLDCRDRYLHDQDGDRNATAIVAFACTAGEDEQTYLHLSDLFLTCDDGNLATPPLTYQVPNVGPGGPLGPGQHGPVASLGPSPQAGIFQHAVYQGDEHLTSGGQPIDKCYWNRAIGLDLQALESLAVTTCTLSGIGTATDTITPATIGPGVHYPIVRWSVQVYTDADPTPNTPGTLCGPNPLDDDGSGTTTEYLTDATDPATLFPITGTLSCGDDAVVCAAGPIIGGANAAVSVSPAPGTAGESIIVTVADVPSLPIALPDGFTLDSQSACCLHECCAAP